MMPPTSSPTSNHYPRVQRSKACHVSASQSYTHLKNHFEACNHPQTAFGAHSNSSKYMSSKTHLNPQQDRSNSIDRDPNNNSHSHQNNPQLQGKYTAADWQQNSTQLLPKFKLPSPISLKALKEGVSRAKLVENGCGSNTSLGVAVEPKFKHSNQVATKQSLNSANQNQAHTISTPKPVMNYSSGVVSFQSESQYKCRCHQLENYIEECRYLRNMITEEQTRQRPKKNNEIKQIMNGQIQSHKTPNDDYVDIVAANRVVRTRETRTL